MNRELEQGTAILATVFGASLLRAEAARSAGAFTPQHARELSVLARILEKRLGDVREAMSDIVVEGKSAPVTAGFVF